jgi:hypothetical protein
VCVCVWVCVCVYVGSVGVYRYKSGAVYEGEWRRNTKHGYGVYTYAKGGSYAGEWVAGRPHGSGVRTLKSAKQSSGLWQEGQLDEARPVWQCEQAVVAADSAATAARQEALDAVRPPLAFTGCTLVHHATLQTNHTGCHTAATAVCTCKERSVCVCVCVCARAHGMVSCSCWCVAGNGRCR